MADREGLPIRRGELAEHVKRANALLTSVKWIPKQGVLSTSSAKPTSEEVSILNSAKRVSGDLVLLAEEVNHTLSVLRTGIEIGAYLSDLYVKASNLDVLSDQNSKGQLNSAGVIEFKSKFVTASAISVFATAYYVVRELQGYKTEEAGKARVNFTSIPEINLRGPVEAIQCQLFYFGTYLEKEGVTTPYEFVRMTLEYFKGVLGELDLKKGSFEYTEPFTQRTYVLEGSDFVVDGFTADLNGGVVSAEFPRVEGEEIVGNRDAKHMAHRIAHRLVCYNPETGRNIMHEMGGFPDIVLGHGDPGGGKTKLIGYTATMISDLCKVLGLPFLFNPLPETLIDRFQGGSAERMDAWMRPFSDPKRIVYGAADDAENHFEDRTRQGVSAGAKEALGVWLRGTEGATTIRRGSSIMGFYSNIPEMLDPAVLSRIVSKVFIGGAITEHDFIDQDYLWYRRYLELDASFIGMEDPAGYAYLESQRLVGSLTKIYEEITEPCDPRVREVFQRTVERYKLTEHAFFGAFFAEIKRVFPKFSSRDLRNIQRAVDGRIMDFDFPSEWLENPEIFFRQDHDRQMPMVQELMRGTMKGLSFAEVRRQEAIRYLDQMVLITDRARERKIQELVENELIRREAERRLKEKH